MSHFASRRTARLARLARNRTRRGLGPAVEGFEPRQLLSGAAIAGVVLTDVTGNGSSSDDTPRAGVTVDLYRKGSTKVLESTKTGANGTYGFTGLPAGSYSVQQAIPANTLPTAGLGGHAVTLETGQALAGENFDDFQLLPKPSLSGVSYTVTTPSGKSTVVTSLQGHVQQGDTVTATFDLKTAEQLTLVAYTAPNTGGTSADLQKQGIFAETSTTGATGKESLTVKVPDGFFQLDFVAGPAIDYLDTNPNILYHAQGRFIDGLRGGTQADPAVATGSLPLGLTVTDDVASVAAGNSQDRKH